MKTRLFSKLFGWHPILVSLVVATTAHAAPGDPDTTFAGTGTKRIGFAGGYDQAYAAAVQADGKLVLAGYSKVGQTPEFSLVRLDTNNVFDASFGDGGTVQTPVSSPGLPFTQAAVQAVRIQADGKIVAAGYATTGTNHSDFALVRYNSDGSLDTTFGTNGTGKVYTYFADGARIRAMDIQSDGKIVVAGYTDYLGANAQQRAVALARYTTNGVLDSSFGPGGIQITTGAVGYTGAHGLMIQPDGKILAVGIGIGAGHNGIDFALYRYTTNGVLDSDFGGGTGKVFTQISTNNNLYFDSAEAVAMQFGDFTPENPDKLVVAGSYRTSGSPSRTLFALTRYNLNGTLDSSFGNGGIVTNPIPGSVVFTHCYAVGVAIQGVAFQPRKIIAGGYGTTGSTDYFILARYNANGTFDTTFGTNGTGAMTIPFPAGYEGVVPAMTVQSDRFVLAGYSGVFSENNYDYKAARFNSDGSTDTNFGAGGVLTADIANLDSNAQGVAMQSDGKMVVAGSAQNGATDVFALARFNVDGSLDSSFGVVGKVTTLPGQGGGANAVMVQPDGKIVVAGSAGNGANDDFAVARYHPNGTLDSSFGTNGIMTTPIGAGNENATAITLQSDGKLVVAGNSHNGANDDFAVVRYTTNGFPDATFDGDGKVITAIATGNDFARAVKVQADGKIVVGGYAEVNGNFDFALVRYGTNGALDNSFGSFGRVATDIGSATTDALFGLVIQTNNRIVAAGYSANGANVDLALVRYLTNGTPDNSFDGDGKVTTPIGLSVDYATAVALQSDSKILAGGVSIIGAYSEFAAVRYNIDGSLDGSYGIGGKAVVDFGDGADNMGNALVLDSIGRAVIAGQAGDLFGVARVQGDPFLKILSISHLGNGNKLLTGLGVPGGNHTLNASGTLNFGSPIPLGPIPADAAGLWQYEDGPLVGVSNRFYRLSSP